MLVALGATQELQPACEVLSYEAPFGVGALVAQRRTPGQPLVLLTNLSQLLNCALARLTVELLYMRKTDPVPGSVRAPVARAAPAVSIKAHWRFAWVYRYD